MPIDKFPYKYTGRGAGSSGKTRKPKSKPSLLRKENKLFALMSQNKAEKIAQSGSVTEHKEAVAKLKEDIKKIKAKKKK